MKCKPASYKGCNMKHGKYSGGGKSTFENPPAVGFHRMSQGVKKFKGTGTNHKGSK